MTFLLWNAVGPSITQKPLRIQFRNGINLICVIDYHSFQNHYTHKIIIIFKLFRSLQLQFSGPTGINFRYSYSFMGLTGIFLYSYSSVQLPKKMVRGIISENYSYSYIKKWYSN